MQKYFLFFLVAAVFSFLFTPLIISFARKFGLVDDPKKRKHPAHTHQGVIPRAGGLSVFLAFLLISSFYFFSANLSFLDLKHLLGITAGAFLIVIIGLLDDKYDLSPRFRFLTNFLAAGLVVGSGTGIAFITNPFGGIIHLHQPQFCFSFFGIHCLWLLADLFAVFWIVWCMNMVNWSKGVDGQMPGFVVIAALVIAIVSYRFFLAGDASQEIVLILSLITAGSFFGFLPWNFYPQKIMPGYSGGSLAGYLLAVFAILSQAKVGTAVLVLALPSIDGFYTLFRRFWKGQSIFSGDRSHFHHHLLQHGWGRRRIAVFYWLVTAILGLISLSLSSQGKLFAFFLVAIFLAASLFYFSLSSKNL